MIEFTRRIAKEVRSVLKKALGRHSVDLRMFASPAGLRIQAQGFEHAAEYHDPTPREPAELAVPMAVLDDVQGSRNDPVVLSAPKKTLIAAAWEERGVAHRMQYHRPKNTIAPFPSAAGTFIEAPPALHGALQHAYETTDVESSRYALGCIQLRGQTGEIAATDGRHLLLQSGFTFGFEDEVLVRNTSVFGCKELPRDQPVTLGRTEEHFVIRVGPWTFYLGLHKEGRFPCVEHVIPDFQSARTTLELNGADAEFLRANLQRLPGGPEDSSITLDLGSTIAIRAKSIDTPAPTELVLSNSHRSGADLVVHLDRHYLTRALAMGFGRIYCIGSAEPMLARDDFRQYLLMPLGGEGAIAASEDCLRIESPREARPVPLHSISTSQFSAPMSINKTAEPPAAAPEPDASSPLRPTRRTRRAAGNTKASPLEQALALREQLRVALDTNKGLIQILKAEKRGQKSLQLALASLKQLQAVA